MIVGVGIDLVDVDRFMEQLERAPRLAERLFTDLERRKRSDDSLAARFAAKEALAKALHTIGDMAWLDAEVVNDDTGRPGFAVRGTVAARCRKLGVRRLHLSITHDGGFAAAFVIAERE
ncbi:MAG: holo-ACP synthase [Bifidobacteriaceae bacterium]|jgi:holo-[acyl-carrier protein] synthase|nr:holo-ACP synthase [Bifidobacteriaceae bacterium]